MKIVGIVAEYNPFHNGHLYHIQQTKAKGATHIVCVLGGNFTQRAEPSIMPKWAKVRAAIACGADLVIELPHPFAIGAAQDFAYGAVDLLDALGCVDAISFGSEVGSMGRLISTVNAITAVEGNLKGAMAEGQGFPSARQSALAQAGYYTEADVIKTPNNILAVEYLLALRRINSRIAPMTVGRHLAAHTDSEYFEEVPICSGTALRKLIMTDLQGALGYMPEFSHQFLNQQAFYGRAPIYMSNLDVAIISRLRAMSRGDFANVPGVSEGLENRICEAVKRFNTVDEIVKYAVSKRYTASRIRRIIIAAVTGVTREIVNIPELPYIRILGQNANGREILRAARNVSTLPKVYKPADIFDLGDPLASDMFKIEGAAYDLYSLGFNPIGKAGLDLTENVYSPY